jgi:SAM-dependent methyltransferase
MREGLQYRFGPLTLAQRDSAAMMLFKRLYRKPLRRVLKACAYHLRNASGAVRNWWSRAIVTKFRLHRNQRLRIRRLEIGPGLTRIPGFETLNVTWSPITDYVVDASAHLPFDDNTFEVIYASHVLEHIPWYLTDQVLREWCRILKHGGRLEVWVPDGLRICKALVDYEISGENRISEDGWFRFNAERDPCKWAAGRLYSYGDGTGAPQSPNWHRSVFTPRYLKTLLEQMGLVDVRQLKSQDVRGYDHGWINLGMGGVKP